MLLQGLDMQYDKSGPTLGNQFIIMSAPRTREAHRKCRAAASRVVASKHVTNTVKEYANILRSWPPF